MLALKSNLLLVVTLLATSCDSSDGEGMPDGSTGSTTDASSSTSTSEPEATITTGATSAEATGTSTGREVETGSSSSSGQDEGGSSSSSTGSADGVEGDIVVEIVYEGALEGPLTVALFAACPPAGPPSAFVQEAAPVFPQAVELTGTTFVAGETPCIIAYVDAGPPSPTSPGEEDPTGEVTLEIAAGEPTTTSLTLADPA